MIGGTEERFAFHVPLNHTQSYTAGTLSISLHPAGRREKGSFVVSNVESECQGGTSNNFQNADAKCSHDYFHKDADPSRKAETLQWLPDLVWRLKELAEVLS
ncbi:hypothetical protein TNCV_744471 [Trichonephila clavipes]|nr:hypothetical protein TNCV_744471 [Trichonephila clavipes]